MIEILNRADIQNVKDEKIKEYLEYSFKRLPNNFEYPEYGYFVVIETIQELESNSIKLSKINLPSIDNGLFDFVELVEIQNEIVEVVILYDNDYGVSFIIPMSILDESHKERLKGYIL